MSIQTLPLENETMYAYFSRIGQKVGAARFMSVKIAHDYRLATPRRIAWAATQRLSGYGGQLVREAAIGTPLACDDATVASVAAIIHR